MTVSTSDPTLPARLPSRYEALSIDVTTDPVECIISLLYPNGNWDMVYQDGVFANTYRNSTRVSSHFEIVRAGGWPSGMTFELKVKEGAAPEAASVPWGLLYSVDMATLPVTSFVTAGSYTLDGLTWWLKGTFTQGGGVIQSADLDGVGLRIRSNFASEATDGATNLRWWLPLTSIPGYDASAPVAVWGRLTSGISDQFANAIVGLCLGTADAVSLTAGQRQTRVGVGSRTSTTSMNTWVHNTTASQSLTLTSSDLLNVYGVEKLSPTLTRRMAALFSAAPPDPYTTADAISSPDSNSVRNHTTTSGGALGVYFAHNFNGGSTQNFHLRNLYIMQPRFTP